MSDGSVDNLGQDRQTERRTALLALPAQSMLSSETLGDKVVTAMSLTPDRSWF